MDNCLSCPELQFINKTAMCRIIENAAIDAGISIEKANLVFAAVKSHLTQKLPELGQLIEDVFSDVEGELLEQHLCRAASLLQQHEFEKYRSWGIPKQATGNIKYSSGGELF